ncbi:MAG: galactokinase [Streptosporangiaceae bacterium]
MDGAAVPVRIPVTREPAGGPADAAVDDRGAAGESTTGDGAGQAARWFADLYAAAPEGVWRAPGRVNLIGEHTDYNEGFVLPFALSAGVTAAAARRDDAMLALASRQAEAEPVTVALADLAPGSVDGWGAYPAGVAWALRSAGYPVGGASFALDADLPLGAGLSSSAALQCAIALALTELYQLSLPRPELAAIARRAENEFVGAPTGIMDQSAALLCRAGHALLLDCRSGETAAVPLDPAAAGLALLVINTRARHALTDGGYGDRRRECEAAARALGVPSLRDAGDDLGVLDELADPVLRRRARHIMTENWRVLETASLLRRRQLGQTGDLLTASHVSLRDDFEISWPEADTAVETAIEAGALGARMIGGGFGGSVIALVPAAQAASIAAEVTDSFAEQGWREPQFADAVPSDSARRLR